MRVGVLNIPWNDFLSTQDSILFVSEIRTVTLSLAEPIVGMVVSWTGVFFCCLCSGLVTEIIEFNLTSIKLK